MRTAVLRPYMPVFHRRSKRSEFIMWATEVKKVDIESLPKWEEKDLFRCAARLQSFASGPHVCRCEQGAQT